MSSAIPAPRTHVNEFAPKIVQIKIDPDKIGEVIGQRGKTINTIIEETGVRSISMMTAMYLYAVLSRRAWTRL